MLPPKVSTLIDRHGMVRYGMVSIVRRVARSLFFLSQPMEPKVHSGLFKRGASETMVAPLPYTGVTTTTTTLAQEQTSHKNNPRTRTTTTLAQGQRQGQGQVSHKSRTLIVARKQSPSQETDGGHRRPKKKQIR